MARPQTKSTPARSSSKAALPQADSASSVALAERVALWDRVVCALVFGTLFLLCCFPLVDTDFWWHLKTGELIWLKKQIPRFDWYTYKDADKPWIDLHWGFQLLVAGLTSLGGTDAVILFKASAYSLTALIGWKTTGRLLPPWLRAVIWICPLILLSGRAMERPEMLTMVFLATSLSIVHRADARPRLLWWLVPLQLLWTNCHALFILGLIVAWCYTADRLIRLALAGRSQPILQILSQAAAPVEAESAADTGSGISCNWIGVAQILAPVFVATLICLVNPYFIDGFTFPLVLFEKFSSARQVYYSIGEFQPPMQFIRDKGWTNINPIALAVLTLFSVTSFSLPLLQGRISLFRLVLLTGFGWLAWTAVRNQNIFALVAAVVITGNLADAWRTSVAPSGWWSSLRTWLWLNRGVALLYCAWIVVIVTDHWGLAKWNDGYRLFGLGERNGWFAKTSALFAGQPGFPKSAFATNIGQAAVYIYKNGPDRKVFMDPRLEVCSKQTFIEHEQILKWMRQGDQRWMDAIRDPEGQFPVLIFDSRFSRDEFNGIMLSFPDKWRLVYAEPAGAVMMDVATADRLQLSMADPSPLMKPPDY